ncbi:uncharacterized protein METZ01_LOCUS201962 [marine metagenome]|uniref:Uncharacterized protein n=1 Tax=marine metagenome TaxID=408172 RepID=A0A382EEG8_9ZZZZ
MLETQHDLRRNAKLLPHTYLQYAIHDNMKIK